MSAPLLNELIERFEQYDFTPEFQAYFLIMKSELLASPEVAAGLVVRVVEDDDYQGKSALLLSLLLDEARMGLENGHAYAGEFLETVETAVQMGLSAKAIQSVDLMQFAGLYRAVGLPVPQPFMLDLDDMSPPADLEPGGKATDITESLSEMSSDILAQGGTAYDVFNAFDTMLAAVPDEACAHFAYHLTTMEAALFERCALYALLSGEDVTQEATIAGIHERHGKFGLTAATVAMLPMIRGWFGDGPVKAGLDALIKKCRRAAPVGREDTRTVEIEEIIASIADGVGAQSIAVRFKRDDERQVAMLLIKAGHGVKDAFLVPPGSADETKRMIVHLRDETGADNISLATFTLLLEGALAEGLQNGDLPAYGIIDVIEACSFFELRPQELSLEDLLSYTDPERKIQDATTNSLGRWINDEAALDEIEQLADSWFEDTEETRTIVQAGRTDRSIEAKIWKYLDGRRDRWARRFLQTALMLQDSGQVREWKTLTASAFGLMNGRSLKRIRLMRDVVDTTIDAASEPAWLRASF